MAQQYPPPSQPAYPPPPPSNQPAYPPPQGGYPTQPGYQPVPAQFPPGGTAEAPPPYYNNPPPQAQAPQSSQQQSTTNVVVVSQQPMPTLVAVHPVRDHYMTMSVVLTILCVLSGFWWALFCTIPAIVFSSMAQDEDRRGDYASAQTHGKVALGLNIASLVSSIALVVISFAVILPIALAVSVSSDTYYDSDCYSGYYYNYYYYYC